jgi:peptidoglycan pentaglycine glycine transferase (the first glycine)
MTYQDLVFEVINNRQVYHQLWQDNKLSFMQSWAWGVFKSPTNDPVRVKCIYDKDRSFVFTIFIKKLPIFNVMYGYIPKFASDQIIQQLKTDFYQKLGYLTRNDLNLKFLLYEPNASYGHDSSAFKSMRRQAQSIQPNETDIIILNGTDNEMLERMDKGTRYEIRKAIKNDCRVFPVGWTGNIGEDKKTVKRFFSVMQSIYDRTNYVMYGEDYFLQAFNIMGSDKLCRIFFVQMGGQDVGAMMHYMDVDTVYEVYGGANHLGRKLSANYLLKWEAMKYSRDEGFLKFDQWGVAPQVIDVNNNRRHFKRDHPLYNISKFKSGFGGQYTEYIGQWAYIIHPLWFRLYRIAIWLNGAYIKLYSRLRKTLIRLKRLHS